jgi:hypothetical protein
MKEAFCIAVHADFMRKNVNFFVSFLPGLLLEGESSNRYHAFIHAKGLFRRLRRSICTNDHEDHIQDTKPNHNQ